MVDEHALFKKLDEIEEAVESVKFEIPSTMDIETKLDTIISLLKIIAQK